MKSMNNEQLSMNKMVENLEEAQGQDICDRTRAYALRIIKLYRVIENDHVGQIIGKQLLRSGTSIGANIEEAQAAQSSADFVHKMNIALKEARESRYWLNLIVDAELSSATRLNPLLQETEEIIRILFTIIKKTRKP